mmetsp:Transcript_8234/g.12611  ORF Transcript_8234/g.12611 Transcript_8234/m.12611 type:complete len:126 (+) Transcript_8234:52-429(+)
MIVRESMVKIKANLFDAMMQLIEEKVGFDIRPAQNEAFLQVVGKTFDELQLICDLKTMHEPERQIEDDIKLWNTQAVTVEEKIKYLNNMMESNLESSANCNEETKTSAIQDDVIPYQKSNEKQPK